MHAIAAAAPASALLPPAGHVTALHRFAVKGLERDSLDRVQLEAGEGLPSDRRWAMIFDDAEESFDEASPQWLHKSNFLCAFTANELLASFSTAFDDSTSQLRCWQRGEEQATPLLTARLTESAGLSEAAAFFSDAAGRKVRFVSSKGQPHAFGNTRSGVSASGDTRVIHLVNAETVAALAAAGGVALHPDRFRGNVLFDGVPAWREFEWVDREVKLGGATLRVVKRTVRCEGVNADGRQGTGAADVDVPQLLAKHFPEHGPYLGVYAQVTSGGDVRLGDGLALVE